MKKKTRVGGSIFINKGCDILSMSIPDDEVVISAMDEHQTFHRRKQIYLILVAVAE